MKSNTLNYIVVGAFVVIILVGLIVSITFLTGRRGEVDTYYTVYDNVTGIKYGTRVLYEGYRIGQVESVDPFEVKGQMRFRIELSVTKDWKIPKDSLARLEAPNLLTAIVVNIEAGESVDPLKPGEHIPSVEASNMFAAISQVAGQVAALSENIKPVLSTIDRTVTQIGDILEDDGAALVKDLRGMTARVNGRLPGILDDVQATTGQIRRLTAQDNIDNVATFIDKMNMAATDLRDLSADLKDTLALVDGMVVNIDGVVADNRPDVAAVVADLRHTSASLARHIDAINGNLEGASRNMLEITRELRRDPSLLIMGTEDEKSEGSRRK